MDEKLNRLLLRIQQLEHELLDEIQKKGQEFGYKFDGSRIRFATAIADRHLKLAKSLGNYLRNAKLLNIISAPIIWFCLVPLLFLHLVVGVYQFICFPIYGIPKVRRQDYIIMDRGRLLYLNAMERINCRYCAYANGLLAYVQEIVGRTEQYWCPIKHAAHLKTRHSRYQHFFEYGDAETFRKQLEEVRRDFDDLKTADLNGTTSRKPDNPDDTSPARQPGNKTAAP